MITVRVKLTFPSPWCGRRSSRAWCASSTSSPTSAGERRGALGWIICELVGDAAHIDAAAAWLRTEGIGVDLLGDVLES